MTDEYSKDAKPETAREFLAKRNQWIFGRDGTVEVHARQEPGGKGWGVYLMIDGHYTEEADARAKAKWLQGRVELMLENEGIKP